MNFEYVCITQISTRLLLSFRWICGFYNCRKHAIKKTLPSEAGHHQTKVSFSVLYVWRITVGHWAQCWYTYYSLFRFQNIFFSKYCKICYDIFIWHPDQDISCYSSELALFLFLWELSIFAHFSLFSILFFVYLSTQIILLFLYWILILIWEFSLGTYGKVCFALNSV